MDSKKYDKTSLTIYIIFILAIILTEFIFFDKSKIQLTDLPSTAIGFITVLWFYFNSQRLLNNNQFFIYGIIGLIVFIICLTKQVFTGFHNLPLVMAGLPLWFIIYFRGLTFLFYKDFKISTKKPVIIFASQYGLASYDGKEKNYVPTMKEKIFSLLLFMGFMFFTFGLLMLLKEIFNVTWTK